MIFSSQNDSLTIFSPYLFVDQQNDFLQFIELTLK